MLNATLKYQSQHAQAKNIEQQSSTTADETCCPLLVEKGGLEVCLNK